MSQITVGDTLRRSKEKTIVLRLLLIANNFNWPIVLNPLKSLLRLTKLSLRALAIPLSSARRAIVFLDCLAEIMIATVSSTDTPRQSLMCFS